MDPRLLRHFVAVAEEGSFTRGAQRVHVVQSAVSASIKTLERQVGVRLLDRTSRSVALTAEGWELLASARQALDALDQVRDVAGALSGGLRGHVAFGVLAAPDLIGVPDVLAAFRARYPDVTVHMRTSPTGGHGLVADLLDESLDASLVVLPLDTTGLHVEPLTRGRHVLTVPAGHPYAARGRALRPAELDGAEFVDNPVGFSSRSAIDAALEAHGVHRRTTVEVSQVELAAASIAAGLGIGFVPEPVALAHPGLVPVDVEGVAPTWTYALATKRHRRPGRAVVALLELLRERAAALPEGPVPLR
jgi:DNA-binding transcriptional LysR family regulator